MLTDNESEFGSFIKAKLPILKYEKYAVGLNIYWEHIWTLPEKLQWCLIVYCAKAELQ